MRISFGFPALIPMLVIFAFNFLSGFLFSGGSDYVEYDNYNHNNYNNHGRSQSRSSGYTNSNARTHRTSSAGQGRTVNYGVEDEGTYTKFLVILVLFIALPVIIRRIMRN